MLEIRNLVSGYGAFQALFGISLDVNNGEALALLGPNGAGKTTLVETVAGLVRTTSGTVTLDGVDITRKQAHERARIGLRLVPTGRALFGPLSVEKNLRLGSLLEPEKSRNIELAFELFPILAERRTQKASTLSGGQQQMLAIARALVGRPELLILDEPSLGLAPVVTEQLYAALDPLKTMGQTIVIVEEKIDFALDFADRYAVLNGGRVVAEGKSADLADRTVLSASYLG